MNFVRATEQYESCLKSHVPIVEADLVLKHQKMACSEFEFLRATFYRWARLFRKYCSELNKAPKVLGVGDLHVENFGTWRDIEGRLAWGINDFDEACPMPYTNDVVRLAASAYFAIKNEENALDLNFKEACKAIQDGYARGLKGQKPFILAEKHDWLRDIVVAQLRERGTRKHKKGEDKDDKFDAFYEKYTHLPEASGPIPPEAIEILNAAFPHPVPNYSIGKREAGLGSLGRFRFTAVVIDWKGGIIVREAKQLAPSAWEWVDQETEASSNAQALPLWCREAHNKAVRSHDPWIRFHQNWTARRIGPDALKLRLNDLRLKDTESLEEQTRKLLTAMGQESANVHSPCQEGETSLESVVAHLKVLSRNHTSEQWLVESALRMVEETRKDFSEWKNAGHQCSD